MYVCIDVYTQKHKSNSQLEFEGFLNTVKIARAV